MWDNFTADNAYSAPPRRNTFDPQTGEQISVVPLNPAAASPKSQTTITAWPGNISKWQNDYRGNFNVGRFSLKPLIGWTYEQF